MCAGLIVIFLAQAMESVNCCFPPSLPHKLFSYSDFSSSYSQVDCSFYLLLHSALMVATIGEFFCFSSWLPLFFCFLLIEVDTHFLVVDGFSCC